MEGEKSQNSDISALLDDYKTIYTGYNRIENSDIPSNSEAYQNDVRGMIDLATNAIQSVNELELFSANEHLKEIPAEHLRFLLLPALLGYFTSKLALVDPKLADVSAYRLTSVRKSKTYYKDFLRLCRMYDVKSVPDPTDSDHEEATEDKERVVRKAFQKDAITRKTEKVLRFKAKKALDSELTDLFTKMSLNYLDDDTQRQYYSKLIDKWVLNILEDLEFIDEEIQILEYMAQRQQKGDVAAQRDIPQPSNPPRRPFILTKTDLQKQVFGAGYPSIPTYTLDEFYDAQVRSGQIPAPGQAGAAGMEAEAAAAEQEEIVKEYKVENDDPETLKKARDWDDWKDDHRRGWGNTKNKG